MSYALKTTGIATKLVFCVAVDEDGTTVKEFVSSSVNSTMTLTGVTTGSKSWKGTSRGYFTTTDDGSGFGYNGPKFGANKPSIDQGSGHPFSLFIACAGMGDNGFMGYLVDGGGSYKLEATSGSLQWLNSGEAGATALPRNGTSYSVGHRHTYGAGAPDGKGFYYATEATADLTEEATGSDAGWGSNGQSVVGIGGTDGNRPCPGDWHLVAMFNDALTDAEFESLHDDWFGTLFDSGGTSHALGGSAAGAATATGGLTHGVPLAGAAAGQATAAGGLAHGVPLAGAAAAQATATGAIDVTGSAGFDFDTEPGLVFGDLAGALTSLARQTAVDIVARAYSTSTGALVATSGTLTTDSAGRLPRWTNPALVAATAYVVVFTRVSDSAVCAARVTATSS